MPNRVQSNRNKYTSEGSFLFFLFFFDFLKKLLIFKTNLFLFVCVCAHNMCMHVPKEVKRGYGVPWSWSCKELWAIQLGCWDPNLGPLEEHYVLLINHWAIHLSSTCFSLFWDSVFLLCVKAVLNSQLFPCLSFPSAVIKGVSQYAQLDRVLIKLHILDLSIHSGNQADPLNNSH